MTKLQSSTDQCRCRFANSNISALCLELKKGFLIGIRLPIPRAWSSFQSVLTQTGVGKLLANWANGARRFKTTSFLSILKSRSFNFRGLPDLFAICIEPCSRYCFSTFETVLLCVPNSVAIWLKGEPALCMPTIMHWTSTEKYFFAILIQNITCISHMHGTTFSRLKKIVTNNILIFLHKPRGMYNHWSTKFNDTNPHDHTTTQKCLLSTFLGLICSLTRFA